jgi:hypothetical protein
VSMTPEEYASEQLSKALGYQQIAHQVMTDVLSEIDGVRGTWSWMLEPGNHGYGLVPFLTNIEQDGWRGTVSSVTFDEPLLLPAFIQWQAPDVDTYAQHETPFPVVKINGGAWLGKNGPLDNFARLTFTEDDEMYEMYDGDIHDYACPVWSVTPIDEEFCVKWSEQFISSFESVDAWLLDYVLCTNEIPHGSFVNPVTGLEEACIGYGPDDVEYNCWCGAQGAVQESVDRIAEGSLWVPTDDQFDQIWSWTVNRWVRAWSSLCAYAEHNKETEPTCLYSSVSSRSPYFRTLGSDDLTQQIEQLSSTRSMSSLHYPESLPEHSPQLTLFGT